MAVADQSSGSQNRRRRVVVRRIENEDARHVCFSKRRAGLFRKASEISTLCGADIAIIVNSPTGRPFSFGSPALDPIVNRFLSNTLNQPGQNFNYPAGLVNHLNQELMILRSQLDNQLTKKPVLNERIKAASDKSPECEWVEKIEQLNYDELVRLFDTLCQTKSRAISRQFELLNNIPNQLSRPVAASVDPPFLMNRTGKQFEPGTFVTIPRSINSSLIVGLHQGNPLNIPINPNPANGFSLGLVGENSNPTNSPGNNMIIPYQSGSQALNQQGGFVQNSTVQLSSILNRFNQFNSDLVGTSRLNIVSSRFNPISSGSNLDPNGLKPDSFDPNPGL